jgi:hypothetical protein
MSKETRREILDIIGEIGYGDNAFLLTNTLYGLYDGYLYDEMIQYADEVTMSKALYRRILNVFRTACEYPKYERVIDRIEEVDAVEPTEYYEGMGVAEGKLYLASV